jgi:predicted transcriptional regulator
MEIKISPELQVKRDRLAAAQGRDRESLVREAVERLVGYNDWFVREVEKGLAQIERGELKDHQEVVRKLDELIKQRQRT